MNKNSKANFEFLAFYLLSFAFCIITFATNIGSFWLNVTLSSLVLIFLSIRFGNFKIPKKDINLKTFLIGFLSAILLYLIFYIGNIFIENFFNWQFLNRSQDIYNIKENSNVYTVLAILLFITSPCEELFWRGYILGFLKDEKKLSKIKAILISTLLYASIHIFSGNVLFILASLVAGIYWSSLYVYTKNLLACILSHGIWAILIYIILPI